MKTWFRSRPGPVVGEPFARDCHRSEVGESREKEPQTAAPFREPDQLSARSALLWLALTGIAVALCARLLAALSAF